MKVVFVFLSKLVFTKTIFSPLSLVLLLGVSCAQANKSMDGKGRKQMSSEKGCSAYTVNLKKALAGVNQPPAVSAPASSVHYFEVVDLNENEWTELLLVEQVDVQFLQKPEKAMFDKGFAGMAAFTAKRSGNYFFSADQVLWIDLIDQMKWGALKDKKELARLAPEKFEMQKECKGLIKTVGYKLEEGKRYLLQVSSAKKGVAKIFISGQ